MLILCYQIIFTFKKFSILFLLPKASRNIYAWIQEMNSEDKHSDHQPTLLNALNSNIFQHTN